MKYLISIPLAIFYVFAAVYPAVSKEEPPVVPVHSGYANNDIKKGWYWYEIMKEKKEEPVAEPVPAPSASPSPPLDPWKMSVEEFKELLEKTKNTAVANPTIENMQKYIELQDITRKKALAFANVYQMFMQTHPEYSVASTVPISNPGIDALRSIRANEVESAISASRDDFALVYFHKPDCRFCGAQNGILKYFIDKYGWNIKAVNLYEDPGAGQRFHVMTVPYILAVYRATGDYMPVTVGVASMNELEQKLYMAIRYLKGEVTPSQFSIYNYDLGGPGDPDKR